MFYVIWLQYREMKLTVEFDNVLACISHLCGSSTDERSGSATMHSNGSATEHDAAQKCSSWPADGAAAMHRAMRP